MSGYFVLKSQQNNGTKSNSRKKHQLFCQIFFCIEGQEKAFITMSEFYTKPSRRLYKWEIEVEKKRFCKYYIRCNEATKNVAHNAMKQEKRKRNYIYDAMKQILPQQLEGILVMVVASMAVDIETNCFIIWDKMLFEIRPKIRHVRDRLHKQRQIVPIVNQLGSWEVVKVSIW